MLELIEKTARRHNNGGFIYVCKCFCGNIKEVQSYKFNGNRISSCGCLRGKAGTHGQTKHPLFARYRAMLARCSNPKSPSYNRYGARGIKVCAEWKQPMPEGFDNFLRDMGDCPEGYTLERKDSNGDYNPINCIWATVLQQANNKRNNRIVELNGETKTLAQWADHFKVKPWRISYALKYYGCDFDRVQEFCESGLYLNNKSGHNNIHFVVSKNSYQVNYKEDNKNKCKRFKTIDEALQFRDKERCHAKREGST